jgi:hypothetical protein
LNLFRIVSGVIISLSSGATAPAAAFDSLLVIRMILPLFPLFHDVHIPLIFFEEWNQMNLCMFRVAVVFSKSMSLY